MTDIERYIWSTYYHLFDRLISIIEIGDSQYLVIVECYEKGSSILDGFIITYPE